MTVAISRQMQRAIPYVLSTALTAVGGAASVPVTAQIPGDADFEVRYINAQFTSNLATIQVTDSGTRLQMMNRPVYIALVTGVGQQPFVLPQPALFSKNSNIEVLLTDLSGAPNSIQVAFVGFLLYPAPQQQM